MRIFAGSGGAEACADAGPGLPPQVRAAFFPSARSASMMLRMKLVTWATECGCALSPVAGLFTLADGMIENGAVPILMPRRPFVVENWSFRVGQRNYLRKDGDAERLRPIAA